MPSRTKMILKEQSNRTGMADSYINTIILSWSLDETEPANDMRDVK